MQLESSVKGCEWLQAASLCGGGFPGKFLEMLLRKGIFWKYSKLEMRQWEFMGIIGNV